MAGMPERAAVFYDSGPVFETREGFKGTVLAQYPENESPLASGFLQGEKLIQGKAAALDVEARRRTRRAARLPPAVARSAVRHVPHDLQRDQPRQVADRAEPRIHEAAEELVLDVDLASISTPRVLVDRAKVHANIASMQQLAAGAGVTLRPHCKTHKSVTIARWQLDAGAVRRVLREARRGRDLCRRRDR